jgi:hypothetical protein
MTRLPSVRLPAAYRTGWLLLAADLGQDIVIAGTAHRPDLAVRHGRYGTEVSITAQLTDPVLPVPGRPLEEQLWSALQSWPDERAGRRWPPEMRALLTLARNHPAEYEHLRESEAVLRALGGT